MLPDSFKFIGGCVGASLGYVALVGVVIFGGTAVGVSLNPHGSVVVGGIFTAFLALLVAGVACVFKLPAAFAQWREQPQARSALALAILVAGVVMALVPVCVLLFALRPQY